MRLGVNIDHIATLRQARQSRYPDPVEAAYTAIRSGADQITVHVREDRRHIQDRDLILLRKVVPVPLNLEMAATASMVSIALEQRPDVVTLVPERREEVTTEGGLNLLQDTEGLRLRVRMLQETGIRVSAFIDPDLGMVKAAHKLGCDAIEIHTGDFAQRIEDNQDAAESLDRITRAAQLAHKLSLYVAAGHGLTRRSTPLIAAVQEIEELNIGHALISDALFCGLAASVQAFKSLMTRR